jgi:hypothetical protein
VGRGDPVTPSGDWLTDAILIVVIGQTVAIGFGFAMAWIDLAFSGDADPYRIDREQSEAILEALAIGECSHGVTLALPTGWECEECSLAATP